MSLRTQLYLYHYLEVNLTPGSTGVEPFPAPYMLRKPIPTKFLPSHYTNFHP
ncbi:uncharacterized protein BO80DRAFT_283397 [Aspergillus ibericus CBS 121593]|uniref:Uncharacterized protein n=1 Tax=Aspergillus ibericus CBS 121593 TaxID=1448316 RepID=A0A395H6A8_9EURO|nr:hypothetical protein BO80DRAFT_283397 [Aspergillus ibericus CBS 121593]RAL03437.1 hypothetical protein BO80DRAFT_283397 [Aspergillus ibericus CBS 121593]